MKIQREILQLLVSYYNNVVDGNEEVRNEAIYNKWEDTLEVCWEYDCPKPNLKEFRIWLLGYIKNLAGSYYELNMGKGGKISHIGTVHHDEVDKERLLNGIFLHKQGVEREKYIEIVDSHYDSLTLIIIGGYEFKDNEFWSLDPNEETRYVGYNVEIVTFCLTQSLED